MRRKKTKIYKYFTFWKTKCH